MTDECPETCKTCDETIAAGAEYVLVELRDGRRWAICMECDERGALGALPPRASTTVVHACGCGCVAAAYAVPPGIHQSPARSHVSPSTSQTSSW